MKTERFTPRMFFIAAFLVFVVVMVAAGLITKALAPLADYSAVHTLFHIQDTRSIFMPILSRSASPQDIMTNPMTQDSGLIPQNWDENANP